MTEAACVRVELASGGYDVIVGRGLLADAGKLVSRVDSFRRVHVLEDAGVPEVVRRAMAASLPGAVSRSSHPVSEDAKSLATLEGMLVALAEAQLERTDLVVALGGGILGDVAGLAAGLHRRGVRVAQCPTTLLAMVDASVGGKTGLNLRATIDGTSVLLKNAVGVFHQPAIVIADVDVLASLPERDLRGGLAECIKHAVIAGEGGEGLLDVRRLTAVLPKVLSRDPHVLTELVHTSVALKASVVAGDERETAFGTTPGRRALNLGHTFAHAIEACDWTRVEVDGGLSHPTHGEAVGLGLIAAARLAELATGLGGTLRGSVERAVAAAGLPTRLACSADVAALLAAMRQDKKASSGRLRLVVPGADGVSMLDDPGDAQLAAAWSAIA